MKSLVTVFIPTYNRADFLRETIESVLNQTHQPIKLIVLDDCSSDETPQVVAEFAGDPRFRSVRHSKNVGMAGNWRAGLELVETPYFCLLNDDDLLAPQAIEKLLQPMENDPELIVSFCDHWVIDGSGERLLEATEQTTDRHGRRDLPAGLIPFGEASVLHRSLHISCSLLRTKLVPPHFIEKRAKGFACGWLFYQCYLTGHQAWYLPERLASYRVHDGNMIGNPAMTGYISEGQIFWCRRLLKDPLPEPLRSRVFVQVAQIYASHGYSLVSGSRNSEARRFLRRSFAVRPSAKALVGLVLNFSGRIGRSALQCARQLIGRRHSLHHTVMPFAWEMLAC